MSLPASLEADLANTALSTARSRALKQQASRTELLKSTDVTVLKNALKQAWAQVDELSTAHVAVKKSTVTEQSSAPKRGTMISGRYAKLHAEEDVSNPQQDPDFRRLSQEAREQRATAATDGIFSLFARIDTDHSGSIDAEEIHEALSTDKGLRARFAKAVGMTADAALEKIERAVVGQMDEDWDGKISPMEFFNILEGKKKFELISAQEKEARRLKGAAARARQHTADGGGFQGLTAEEALRIGEAAMHVGSAAAVEVSINKESEPTKFHDGVYFMTNKEAGEERAKRMAEYRQLEHDEYTYKNDFKGLTAEEALKIGEASRHYGKGVKMEYGAANQESDPTKFDDGAYYATNKEAGDARAKRIEEIHQLEHDEYTYKNDFKGLTAEEAAARGAEAQRIAAEKPGESFTVTLDSEADVKKATKMKERMAKRLAAREAARKAKAAR